MNPQQRERTTPGAAAGMKITHRAIAEGTQMPRWYAVAYVDHYWHVAVCYPIGIHMIIGAWEWLCYKFTRVKQFTFMRAPIRTAYHAGYRDACRGCDEERIREIVLKMLEHRGP